MAEWRARGAKKAGRPHGATDGHNAHSRTKMTAKARAEAEEIVKQMEENGIAIPKDEHAREAFKTVVGLLRRDDINPKDKLAVARTILEWTMAKPANETNLNVKKAEDFLSEIAGDM